MLTTLGFVILGTHSAICLVLLLMIVQYHRRRTYQPIRSRLYWQGEATAAALIVTASFGVAALTFNSEISCKLYTAYGVLIMTGFVLILLRAAHVYSAFEVSKLVVQEKAINNKVRSRPSFIIKYAPYIQSAKFQTLFIVGSFIWNSGMWATVTFAIDAGIGCNQFGVYGGVCLVQSVILAVPTVYLAKNIAMLKDGLSIKKELVTIGIIGFFTTAAFVILWITFQDPFWSIAVSIVVMYSTVCIQIGMPLYISYTWQHFKRAQAFGEYSPNSSRTTLVASERILEVDSPLGPTPSGLQRLLRDPISFPSFVEYCRLQLNHENPLFYRDSLPLLKQAKEDPEFIETQEFSVRAHFLYHTYMKQKAHLQINLSWKHHQQIIKACFDNEPSSFLPKEAYKAISQSSLEVFRLMYDDVFPRYFASDYATNIL